MTGTVNIRCGSDIREKLGEGGVPGDFVEYSDPVCQGPVPDDVPAARFRDMRAAFIASHYGGETEAIRARLEREDQALAGTLDRDRIVLWFEHDLYDQAILIRLLDWFGRQPTDLSRLRLVSIDRFPGIERFIGLGQLTASQLAGLLPQARPVTPDQVARATESWAAYRAGDPMRLAGIAADGTPELPFLAPSLRRHLQELPWVGSGLGLTERLALEAAANGAGTPAGAFAATLTTDPMPFLGNVMFLAILRGLATAAQPALAPLESWGDRLQLTGIGRALLDGAADWIALNGIDRWLGGAHLRGPRAAWRWNAMANTVEAAPN